VQRTELAREVRVEADRVLAADTTRCAAEWGVCPAHGNTLRASGGRTGCGRPARGQTWPGDRLGAPVDRAAAVAAVVAGALTPDQAAARAGRSTRTIRRWLAAERSTA